MNEPKNKSIALALTPTMYRQVLKYQNDNKLRNLSFTVRELITKGLKAERRCHNCLYCSREYKNLKGWK